jgi:hypothetical protein
MSMTKKESTCSPFLYAFHPALFLVLLGDTLKKYSQICFLPTPITLREYQTLNELHFRMQVFCSLLLVFPSLFYTSLHSQKSISLY